MSLGLDNKNELWCCNTFYSPFTFTYLLACFVEFFGQYTDIICYSNGADLSL